MLRSRKAESQRGFVAYDCLKRELHTQICQDDRPHHSWHWSMSTYGNVRAGKVLSKVAFLSLQPIPSKARRSRLRPRSIDNRAITSCKYAARLGIAYRTGRICCKNEHRQRLELLHAALCISCIDKSATLPQLPMYLVTSLGGQILTSYEIHATR